MRSVMARKMKIQWECDAPGCTTTEESVSDNGYGTGSPPNKWGFLNLNLETEDEGCECSCHEYYHDDEDRPGHERHEEEDCACAEEDELQGQICICPKCVEKVQAAYYMKKGALL